CVSLQGLVRSDLDAEFLQPEALDARRAADGAQQLVELMATLGTRMPDDDALGVALALTADRLVSRQQLDAVGRERLCHELSGVRVFARQQPFAHLDHR